MTVTTFPVCIQRWGVWNLHMGGTGHPCTCSGGTHRWGPCGKKGRGHANTVCMPPPLLYTPVCMSRRRQSGRVSTEDAGERKGGGEEGVGALFTCYFPLFVLFKPCFITTYLVAQNNTKSGVQITWRKNGPDCENGAIHQKLPIPNVPALCASGCCSPINQIMPS